MVVRRKTDALPVTDPAGRTFGPLLCWIMDRGTRPGGSATVPGKTWSNQELADAIGGVTPRTISNYRREQSCPSQTELGLLETVLFGNRSAHPDWPEQFRQAWAAFAATRGGPGGEGSTWMWEVGPVVQLEGTVELSLHRPELDNESPDVLRLPVTLRFGRGEQWYKGEGVHIAVESASFAVVSESFGYEHADDMIETDDMQRVAGQARVKGPRVAGILDGEVQVSPSVTRLRARNSAGKPITVQVSASPLDFRVDPLGPVASEALPVTVRRLLKAIVLDDFPKDGQGRPIIAKVTAERRRTRRP